MELPREDLYRMTPSGEARLDSDPDAGNTMVGYPIVFNTWAEISGWEGNFLERIAPSALAKTLKERGDKVKVLFNHGMDPQIGDKPLGKPAVMKADDSGLWTETPLADTSYNNDLKVLMRTGVIDGMSFRFSVTKEDIDEEPEPSESNPKGLPERTITELKLYEYGPVTFPAYEATSAGIRGQQGYQAWLRDRRTRAAADGTAQPSDDKPPFGHLTPQQRADFEQKLAQLAEVSNWTPSKDSKPDSGS
jgi:HK97 family phage prohead protease